LGKRNTPIDLQATRLEPLWFMTSHTRLARSFSVGSEIESCIDRVTEPGGIEAFGLPLGDRYPQGLFVAQDDLNINPDANQNLKLVSWETIAGRRG
jgi:myo-inositol-hexaphosphate 3-phosphohydrolase